MLRDLGNFLKNETSLAEDQVRVTGLFVLYNNLLKSLFDSQIKTLGVVFAVIYLMLVALFRSFYLSFISMLPTTLPILLILGTMGALHISLDMMTIMIASVTMGIAVDNMIQYTFRHRDEFRLHGNYASPLTGLTTASAGRSSIPISPSLPDSASWHCRISSRQSTSESSPAWQ